MRQRCDGCFSDESRICCSCFLLYLFGIAGAEVSLHGTQASKPQVVSIGSGRSHLSSSLVLLAFARFLLGTGILHSIENATQFVHGTLSHVSVDN